MLRNSHRRDACPRDKKIRGETAPPPGFWGGGGSVSRGSIAQQVKRDENRDYGLDWAGPG